jgi:K319L-like, PKD domain
VTGTPPTLTVSGFGPLTGAPFTNVTAPPAAVTVTSSSGGSATMALAGSGQAFLPAAPVAAATVQTPVILGQTVRLDGTGSTGEIDSYAWTQTSGPAVTLTGADTATATFVPTEVGAYAFTLAVAGPGGQGIPTTVTVDAINVRRPTADAGVDQTVVRGRTVALDGSRSVTAETYSWRQVSGPAVTLTGATSARPTFTYPAQALPATPGPNAAFVFDNNPVVLELTVRSARRS